MSRPIAHKSQVRDVAFGNRVKLVEPVNLYECRIGDDCFIGPFVEIQKGVVVGNRTRVQSHSMICELVEIGDDCFIGHGVMFTNDTFAAGGPASRSYGFMAGNEDRQSGLDRIQCNHSPREYL